MPNIFWENYMELLSLTSHGIIFTFKTMQSNWELERSDKALLQSTGYAGVQSAAQLSSGWHLVTFIKCASCREILLKLFQLLFSHHGSIK